MKTFSYNHPVSRLVIALIISALLAVITSYYNVETITKIMICWDGFGLIYLALSWMTFMNTNSVKIRKIAISQDKIHFLIFIILIIAAVFSLFAIILLLSNEKQNWQMNVTVVYILGSIISWSLLHTVFGFHYAHMYYGSDSFKENKRGLIFPEEYDPDYIDFAYFSFIIGMTFQVSDVSVKSRQIRRFVLLHSLLSFAFNTFILALIVNLVVNFYQK